MKRYKLIEGTKADCETQLAYAMDMGEGWKVRTFTSVVKPNGQITYAFLLETSRKDVTT